MRYRGLPGYPALYVDYVERGGACPPGLSSRPDSTSLQHLARAVKTGSYSREALCGLLADQSSDHRNRAALPGIEKLRQAETVAVTARLAPGLFGGTFGDMLSISTAIKLADSLENEGFRAVPLVWIDPELSADGWTLLLAMPDGSLRSITLNGGPRTGTTFSREQALPEKIGGFLSEVLACCPPGRNDDFLAQIQEVYSPGRRPATAFARLFALLMAPWGPILLDAGDPRFRDLAGIPPGMKEGGRTAGAGDLPSAVKFHAVVPTAAWIVGPSEFSEIVDIAPEFEAVGARFPVLWPRVSCTVTDPRSEKTLVRYNRALADLFSGPDKLIEGLTGEKLVPDTVLRFEQLEEYIRTALSRLSAAVPPEDRALGEVIEGSRSKMLYQVSRLKEKYGAAEDLRRETMARQIERACSYLAPGGGLQEDVSLLQILLRHSPDFPRQLQERMDVYRMEHQIVSLE